MKTSPHFRKRGVPEQIKEVFSPWFDGVQRGLEMPNSKLGDRLSDSYEQLVDLATDPSDVPNRKEEIENILMSLHKDEDYVDGCINLAVNRFNTPDLKEQYASTLAQIVTMYEIQLPTEGQF